MLLWTADQLAEHRGTRACHTPFVVASCTIRYTATSTGAGRVGLFTETRRCGAGRWTQRVPFGRAHDAPADLSRYTTAAGYSPSGPGWYACGVTVPKGARV